MTRDKFLEFIGTLDKRLQEVFDQVDELVKEDEDTLGIDFQISARLLQVFTDVAEGK